MRNEHGLLVMYLAIIMVVIQGILAHTNGMLTARQMTSRYPGEKGLPFIWRGAMWGDIFIIPPLLGLVVTNYAHQWSTEQVALLFLISAALSGVMHWVYVQKPFLDSLACRGKMTTAGWIHFWYMTAAFSYIGLFYFCTSHIENEFIVTVSAALALHVIIGNHVPLGILNQRKQFEWCPEFLSSAQTWQTITAAYAAVSALTWWASNLNNALLVVLICAVMHLSIHKLVKVNTQHV